MKLIDLNGVKVLFDILMERIGVEIYTKAEADDKFQPKGDYVEATEIYSLERDCDGIKEQIEGMGRAIGIKANEDDVYTKDETDEKIKEIYNKIDEKRNNRIPLEEYLLYPNQPKKLKLPNISVLRVEIVGTGIVEFCEVRGNIDATHEFNTVGNMGGGLPHIWLAVDGEEFAIAGPNGSGPLTFSRDFEYIGRIKISWGGDIETCKNRKNHSIILREHDK